jgi:signal transduction histidine kinase
VKQFKWAEAVQQRRTEEALESKRQQEKYELSSSCRLFASLTKGSFIDMTSHELRNPLSAVVQCADSVINTLQAMVIKPDAAPAAKIDHCIYQDDISVSIDSLHTIVSCSLHQKRVIDDVLTLSKLDSSLITISPMRVQPTTVVSEALKIFDVECNQTDIKLSFRRDGSMEAYDWVMLDPSRLLQVLINLL